MFSITLPSTQGIHRADKTVRSNGTNRPNIFWAEGEEGGGRGVDDKLRVRSLPPSVLDRPGTRFHARN